MLDDARETARLKDINQADDYMRKQIIAYLTVNDDEQATGPSAVLYDATNIDLLLSIIENAVRDKGTGDIAQQALRLLEDYPQHYGLYFILTALQSIDGNEETAIRSLRSMIHFGIDNYGLSPTECADNFAKFLDSNLGAAIRIETFDALVENLATTTHIPYEQMLDGLSGAKANTIKTIRKLSSTISAIRREMKWKTKNIAS